MREKVLMLTSVYKQVNEKGLERVEKIRSEYGKSKKDDYGRTAEWYEDAGLPVPEYFSQNEQDEVDQEGMVPIKEDELEEVLEPVIVSLSDFSSAITIADEDEYTTVYTKSGISYPVVENVYEIYSQIDYLQQSFLDRIKYKLKLN